MSYNTYFSIVMKHSYTWVERLGLTHFMFSTKQSPPVKVSRLTGDQHGGIGGFGGKPGRKKQEFINRGWLSEKLYQYI